MFTYTNYVENLCVNANSNYDLNVLYIAVMFTKREDFNQTEIFQIPNL
jgi:hypothetical protein